MKTPLGVLGCLLLLSACGKPGPAGTPGAAGPSGPSCSVLPAPGGAEIVCPGYPPQTITNGAQGQPGATGATGAAGAAATPCSAQAENGSAVITCPDSAPVTTNGVTMVQFCPNYATTYPSSFPEFGFCIGGNIYATYWNGTQAFTAEVVPGYYTSTSPQGCNFEVLTNCGISW